jgi:hypothetical protein
LTLLALPRMWADFNPTHPMTFVYAGGLAAALIGLVTIYIWAERRIRAR